MVSGDKEEMHQQARGKTEHSRQTHKQTRDKIRHTVGTEWTKLKQTKQITYESSHQL